MGTALDDTTVAEHDDHVGVAHRGEAVGDDERGATPPIRQSMPRWTTASVRVSMELAASPKAIAGSSDF